MTEEKVHLIIYRDEDEPRMEFMDMDRFAEFCLVTDRTVKFLSKAEIANLSTNLMEFPANTAVGLYGRYL